MAPACGWHINWEDSRAAWSPHTGYGGDPEHLRVSGGDPEHLRFSGGDPEHLRFSGGDLEHLLVSGGDPEHLRFSGGDREHLRFSGGDPEHLCISVLALGPSARLQVEAAWPSQCWAQGQLTHPTLPKRFTSLPLNPVEEMQPSLSVWRSTRVICRGCERCKMLEVAVATVA